MLEQQLSAPLQPCTAFDLGALANLHHSLPCTVLFSLPECWKGMVRGCPTLSPKRNLTEFRLTLSSPPLCLYLLCSFNLEPRSSSHPSFLRVHVLYILAQISLCETSYLIFFKAEISCPFPPNSYCALSKADFCSILK